MKFEGCSAWQPIEKHWQQLKLFPCFIEELLLRLFQIWLTCRTCIQETTFDLTSTAPNELYFPAYLAPIKETLKANKNRLQIRSSFFIMPRQKASHLLALFATKWTITGLKDLEKFLNTKAEHFIEQKHIETFVTGKKSHSVRHIEYNCSGCGKSSHL